MDIIRSRDNEGIKLYVKLSNSRKERDKEDKFVIEGDKLLKETIVSGVEIYRIYVSKGYYERERGYIDGIVGRLKDRVCLVEDSIGIKMSNMKSPQGIFGICKKLDKKNNIDKIYSKGKYIGLSDIQDPGNVGTILRSAEAFGVDGVLIGEGCCDIYNPKVVRGTMGAIFRVPIRLSKDLNKDISEMTSLGVETYAAVLSEDSKSLRGTRFNENSLIVLGNEGRGLREDTIKCCKYSIKIDMRGQGDSLNVAMASSILIWELMK